MSRFEFIRENEEFEIWKYTPDIFHAFPFYMEQVRLPWRIRCIMEYFVGYRVYYIKKQNQWAGYCVVSNGKNPRYSFSTEEDIIYGRYFVAKNYRGNHLAVRMLKEILDNSGIPYNKAFAYVRRSNFASITTMKIIGAKEVKRFDIIPPFRYFSFHKDGEFILYEYQRLNFEVKTFFKQ